MDSIHVLTKSTETANGISLTVLHRPLEICTLRNPKKKNSFQGATFSVFAHYSWKQKRTATAVDRDYGLPDLIQVVLAQN